MKDAGWREENNNSVQIRLFLQGKT